MLRPTFPFGVENTTGEGLFPITTSPGLFSWFCDHWPCCREEPIHQHCSQAASMLLRSDFESPVDTLHFNEERASHFPPLESSRNTTFMQRAGQTFVHIQRKEEILQLTKLLHKLRTESRWLNIYTVQLGSDCFPCEFESGKTKRRLSPPRVHAYDQAWQESCNTKGLQFLCRNIPGVCSSYQISR